MAENCFKKLDAERKSKTQADEVTLNCYGCGKPGFYRSNCPDCNGKPPNTSPKKLDFNSIQSSISPVGRICPMVEININALDGLALFDTGARTSVASQQLYQKLKEKGIKLEKVFAEICLADGIPRKDIVYSTIANIKIGHRFKRIRFICLPNASENRTLLGIDFIEQCGIVLDCAQRYWFFKDEPQKVYEFKISSNYLQDNVAINNAKLNEANVSNIRNFLTCFEKSNSSGEYVPEDINQIFENSLPRNFEVHVERDLFPPMKRKKENADSSQIELNSLEVNLNIEKENYLKPEEIEILENFLKTEDEIFGEISVPVKNIEHFIKTGDHEPISTSPYRISPAMKIKLKTELDDMIAKAIVQEMESPWAFPVVLIPKTENAIRVCIYYRRLNKITTTDTYSLPRIDDLLHAAKTTPYMTTIDLKSGYWQIKIADKDKLKTAFTTPFGIYVFNRMPFGLKNAPATFQRVIDKFRSGLPSILILIIWMILSYALQIFLPI